MENQELVEKIYNQILDWYDFSSVGLMRFHVHVRSLIKYRLVHFHISHQLV
jgi:hypothetical protein